MKEIILTKPEPSIPAKVGLILGKAVGLVRCVIFSPRRTLKTAIKQGRNLSNGFSFGYDKIVDEIDHVPKD